MLTKMETMFVLNYYIENGTFTKLNSIAPNIVKKINKVKKENDYSTNLTYAEYLELKYLGNTNAEFVGFDLIKQLIGVSPKGKIPTNDREIPKNLNQRLTRIASKYPLTAGDASFYRLVEGINDGTMLGFASDIITKSRDWTLYNSAINAILLNINMKANQSPNFKINRLKDFETHSQVMASEPLYEEVLWSLTPTYGGPIENNTKGGPTLTFEGLKYYGVNLHLQNSLTLIDDILMALQGQQSGRFITASIRHRLDKMVEVLGNVNYIGLDEFELLKKLNIIAVQSGFATIKELLEAEGYSFSALTDPQYGVIPSFDQYELLIEGYDKYQIRIEKSLYDILKSMDAVKDVFVGEVPYKGTTISIAAFKYEKTDVKMLHTLLTYSEEIDFLDGNTLNITKSNLRGA